MTERSREFIPTIQQGLIITCSDYSQSSNFLKLPTSKNDGLAILNFLKNECKFDEDFIEYLPDKKKKSIESRYDSIKKAAKYLGSFKAKCLYFLYYSGHGTLDQGATYGHTIYGERIALESMARQLAVRAETYVIAFFDCCRQVDETKKEENAAPVQLPSTGQLYTIYASAPTGKATSLRSSELSVATESFLKLMRDKQVSMEFRQQMMNWDAKSRIGIEITDKTSLSLHLKPRTHQEDLMSLVQFFDTDGNGRISLSEMSKKRSFLPGVDPKITTKGLNKLFKSLGLKFDENYEVDRERFLQFLKFLIERGAGAPSEDDWRLWIHSEERKKLINDNVVKRIKDAMDKFVSEVHIQEQACAALFNLAAHRETQLNLVKDEKIVEHIKQVMVNHPNHPTIQEYACGVFLNLTQNDENKVILVKNEKIVQHIKDAMVNHPNHPTIQENACGVIWNLAVNGENQVILVKEEKIVQHIKNAMVNHPNHPTLQQKACGAISNLAVNGENKVILVKEEKIVQHIKNAMVNHPNHPTIQEQACGAIRNLAVNGENKVILLKEEKIVQHIKNAMVNHPNHPTLQQKACGAIWGLAVNRENQVILVKEEKIVQHIKNAMVNHPNHPTIQEYACGAIWNLAWNNGENKVILGKEEKIVELLKNAMVNHPNNNGVQQNAGGALMELV